MQQQLISTLLKHGLVAAFVSVALACGSAVDIAAGATSTGGATSATTDPPSADTTTVSGPPPATSTSSGPGPLDSTTSEGTTDNGDADDLPTGGCGFLGCGDVGTSSVQCSFWDQNCPPGEKCAPWADDGGSAWNATKCVPVERDPGAPGEPCTVTGPGVSGLDSCDIGSMCWTVGSDSDEGTCVAHCTGSENDPACTDPQSLCSIGADAILALCFPTCDPLDPPDSDTCPEGSACFFADYLFRCWPVAPEPAGAFESCESALRCEAGLACANADFVGACGTEAGCCTPWCDLSNPDCEPAMTCSPWFESGTAWPGAEHVGVCTIE